MIQIVSMAVNLALGSMMTSSSPFVPEDYLKSGVWAPAHSNTYTSVAAMSWTDDYHNYDSCTDDCLTVPATGSLPTDGTGAPTLPWDGWFTSLFDHATITHYYNGTSTKQDITVTLESCNGYQQFVGQTTGNKYKRIGSEWHYSIAQTAG